MSTNETQLSADAGLVLPTHYRDDDPYTTSPNAQICEHSGTGDMAQGCPRGCEGASSHYANDGHAACEDAPPAMRL